MSVHYADDTITLHHGDCIDVLREMPEASIDAIVTDPPYGLGFMGKEWDALPPGEEWARECLRVLKPGGHLLAFGGSRTWHRLAVAIEDAGFEIRDSIAWLYGSGFPKSLDVSKAIDKAAGHWRGKAGAVSSDNAAMGGPNYERTPKGDPVTAAAAAWEGWGTALKPAFEPCVVARKPLVGTVAANVLEHGTGALNVDACRIGSEVLTYGGERARDTSQSIGAFSGRREAKTVEGRWPANVVLDENQAEALDEQSGTLNSGTMRKGTERQPRTGGTVYGADARNFVPADTYGDSGGASRFFYVAKADNGERVTVDGIAHPTVKPLALIRWLVRLVTPGGGIVLDTFAGSGTTGEACLLEGVSCILIEREAEYLPLTVERIQRAQPGLGLMMGGT